MDKAWECFLHFQECKINTGLVITGSKEPTITLVGKLFHVLIFPAVQKIRFSFLVISSCRLRAVVTQI